MTGTQSAARRDVLLALLLGAVSIATYLIYPVLNHGPSKIFLQTPLDRAIPLVPVMVIPYLSLIPLISVAAVVFAIAGARRVQALALAATVALLVSYLVYAPSHPWLAALPVSGARGSGLPRSPIPAVSVQRPGPGPASHR